MPKKKSKLGAYYRKHFILSIMLHTYAIYIVTLSIPKQLKNIRIDRQKCDLVYVHNIAIDKLQLFATLNASVFYNCDIKLSNIFSGTLSLSTKQLAKYRNWEDHLLVQEIMMQWDLRCAFMW